MNGYETLDLVWNLSGIITILSFVTAAGVDNHYEFYRNERNERILLILSKTLWFIGKFFGAFCLILLITKLLISMILSIFS